MERVVLLSDGDEITEVMLDFLVPDGIDGGAAETASDRSLEDAVRTRIEAALRASGGNIRQTAAALGISRNTLRARMDKYGLRQRDRGVPAGASPMTEAVPVPWASAQWDNRRLAFLRVRLLAASPGEGPRALEMVADKVRAFGGRIEESGPTGVIAVFGLEPVDNASSHAALAAVAMRNTMAQGRVTAVFAIHCADHLVGRDDATPLIGMDGKAATWSLLETLVGVDSPGAIVVSGPVAPFLARRFALERAAERDVWRVLRLEEVPAGWRATRFVGRAAELGALRRAASLAERGQGQVVGIVGEAGVGKSRLVREATHALQGWRCSPRRGPVHEGDARRPARRALLVCAASSLGMPPGTGRARCASVAGRRRGCGCPDPDPRGLAAGPSVPQLDPAQRRPATRRRPADASDREPGAGVVPGRRGSPLIDAETQEAPTVSSTAWWRHGSRCRDPSI